MSETLGTPIFRKPARLGEMLVARKVITSAQLQEALEHQRQHGVFLGEAFVSLGILPAATLGPYMKELTTYPFVELADYPIDVEISRLLPEAYARQKMALPFARKDDAIYVAMIKPLDLALVDDLRSRLKQRIVPHLVFRIDLEEAFGKVFTGQERVQSVLDEMSSAGAVESDISVDELLVQAEEAPIVRLVNGITQAAMLSGASDIHIEPQEHTVRVRFREDGVLYEQTTFASQYLPAVVSRIKIMAGLNISERRKPQDGQIAYKGPLGKEVDLRVSLLPQVYGESVVMRVLDKQTVRRSLLDLGMETTLHKQVQNILMQPHGIILVTGPTGSGKTTTLYAMLNAINDMTRKIITVEDPVEYHLAGVNQVQVNPQIGLTFAAALRSIVRQDPDVILVGEIRDRETAEVAIQAAMTGHLVLSTLHTNDAPSALVRLQNIGIEPFLISSAVIGIMAQRLLRTVCPFCKKIAAAPATTLMAMGIPVTDAPKFLAHGAGCSKCGGRGMKGRTAVYELMPMSGALGEMTLRGGSGRQLRDLAVTEGMRSMRDYAIEQALKGMTTMEEITRVLHSAESLGEAPH